MNLILMNVILGKAVFSHIMNLGEPEEKNYYCLSTV